MAADVESRLRSLESGLRLTADKQEIHDVIMRYCRAIDRRDRELLRSCFHPDAIDEHDTPRGVEEFLDLTTARPATKAGEQPKEPNPELTMQMHFIGNVLIEVE